MDFQKYCEDRCLHRDVDDKRNLEPCINCPVGVYAYIKERELSMLKMENQDLRVALLSLQRIRGMKRYYPSYKVHHSDGFGPTSIRGSMVEDPDGEWVKADIAEELYEVVSELSVYKDSPVPNTLIDLAEKVKKKARGEGE